MEVHHHAHTARKKWSHYFWEFLMLFLAVFAGFLAENQREHMVEHRRAKVYASTLHSELLADSTSLSHIIAWTDTLARRFDTLCRLGSKQSDVTTGQLYYYSQFTGWIRNFSSEAVTMEQLKSSGNLRIMKSEVSLLLSEYERRLRTLENDYSLFRIEYETMNSLRLKIFDGNLTVNLFDGSNQFRNAVTRDSVFRVDIPLINPSPLLMKEFIGWVSQESAFWKTNVELHLIPLRRVCTELLSLLRQTYHL